VVVRARKDELVWVPRGTVHHIRNVGDDLSLRLAVAMPPAWHYFSPCEQCGFDDDGPREWCA
jgi:mannose-6-phosphate isomerase-like protein (cupin superfamily)